MLDNYIHNGCTYFFQRWYKDLRHFFKELRKTVLCYVTQQRLLRQYFKKSPISDPDDTLYNLV